MLSDKQIERDNYSFKPFKVDHFEEQKGKEVRQDNYFKSLTGIRKSEQTFIPNEELKVGEIRTEPTSFNTRVHSTSFEDISVILERTKDEHWDI